MKNLLQRALMTQDDDSLKELHKHLHRRYGREKPFDTLGALRKALKTRLQRHSMALEILRVTIDDREVIVRFRSVRVPAHARREVRQRVVLYCVVYVKDLDGKSVMDMVEHIELSVIRQAWESRFIDNALLAGTAL